MKPPKVLTLEPSSTIIEEVDSMAEPGRVMSFEHPMSKTKGVKIKVLRIWLTRYASDQVTIEEDKVEKVFRLSSTDPLSLARASILLEQVAEYGYPRRPFWICQATY